MSDKYITFEQAMTIRAKGVVPQGGSHNLKITHSKVLWDGVFRDFKWSLYFRRGVLALTDGLNSVNMANFTNADTEAIT